MKKKSLSLLIAIALIGIFLVGGTLAWLTSQSASAKNTFTSSNIEITLEETTGTEYKMIPGHTIAKDPKATVLSGSEACYLFVKLKKSANFDDFLTYEVADGWEALDAAAGVYYRTVETGDMGTAYSVLKEDQVLVKSTVTKAMLDALNGANPTLTVTAYASQRYKNNSETFTAAEAWENIRII